MTVLLGVDFGTSNTVAVLRFPDGRSRPLLFDGSPIMPSAVFAEDATLLIGRDAEHSARIRPERFEPNPKRRIDDGTVLLGGRQVEVVDLFAAVLRRVWVEASRIVGGTPVEVTLTHPAAWGRPRTEVLVEAARRAGIINPRLVPEPVAAAAYFVHALGVDIPVGAAVVIYDFGAGTFDASVIRREPGGFAVLADEGLNDAGGLDVDAAIVGYLGATIVGRDPEVWQRLDRPETDSDRRAHRLFWEDVRAAKEILSRTASTYVHVPIIDDSLPIGREQLETLARPVLDRTVAATRLVIRNAGLGDRPPAAIFLVGGSSRMPLAATLLHRGLGISPSAVEQPELVVADGSVHARAVVPSTPTPPGTPASLRPVSASPVSGQPVSGTPQPVPPRATYPPPPLPAQPAAVPNVPGPRAPGTPVPPPHYAPPGPRPASAAPPPVSPGPPPASTPPPAVSPPSSQASPPPPQASPAPPQASPPPPHASPAPSQASPAPTFGSGAPPVASPLPAPAGVPAGPVAPQSVPPGILGPTSTPPATGSAAANVPASALPASPPPTANWPRPVGQPGTPAPTGQPQAFEYPTTKQRTTAGWPVTAPPSAVPLPPPPGRRPGRIVALVAVPAAVVVAAVVTLVVVKPWQSGGTTPHPPGRTTQAVSYEAADNTGPAPRPAEAQHGGRLTVLTDSSLTHLDPAQIDAFDEMALVQLVTRTLTAVRTNGDGTGTLVGDLATDPGHDVNNDCRTWRFTLRDGVSFATGEPVTSRDVAYGIARSFQPELSGGASTLQEWLADDTDYSAHYHGPGTGNTPAPGVSTPDDSTIVFTFPQPHCDVPYAASLPATSPVPFGTHPSGEALNDSPPSSGPYQVSSRTSSSITLTRNSNWRPETDPLRTADPDEIVVQVNLDSDKVAQRLTTDADADQASLAWTLTRTAAARATGRALEGSLGFNLMLGINTTRVTNVDVRRAIAYAINKDGLVGESIGSDAAVAASTLIPPGMAGYAAAPDPYPYDPDKARALLGSHATPVPITVAIRNSTKRQQQARLIKDDLDAVGFKTTIVTVDNSTTILSDSDPYDLALFSYVPWWPSGYEQLRVLFGPHPEFGATHLHDSDIAAEFERIDALPLEQQLAEASKLDTKILRDTAAAVPLFTVHGTYLRGSHAGVVPVAAAFGVPDLLTAYVTG